MTGDLNSCTNLALSQQSYACTGFSRWKALLVLGTITDYILIRITILAVILLFQHLSTQETQDQVPFGLKTKRINRTFFVTVATRWISTLYSILCPYEAAKILCPALCVSWSRASAWLQVMAVFQKGHPLGQDWYIGSIRDSLQSPSLPKNSFTPALLSCPQVPSLALPGCVGLQHSWDLAAPPEPTAWGSGESLGAGAAAGEIAPSLPLFQAQFCSLPGSTSYFSSLSMAKAI